MKIGELVEANGGAKQKYYVTKTVSALIETADDSDENFEKMIKKIPASEWQDATYIVTDETGDEVYEG